MGDDISQPGSIAADKEKTPPLDESSPLKRFLHHDMVGSGLLVFSAACALIVANSGLGDWYHDFWHTEFGFSINENGFTKSLQHWVNDGLMSVFFFLVGLEIKRELLAGELASLRKAILPAMAAVGGMIFPAIVYAVLNSGSDAASGWGIPMATDIAFAAGCIAILRKRVPAALMVFLVALAIVDDLGAVAVIAVFYTEQLAIRPLLIGTSLIVLSFCLNLLGVRRMLPFAVFGIIIWIEFLQSGVHATIAGVLLAFTIPERATYKTQNFSNRMRELLNRFEKAEELWETRAPDDPEPRVPNELMVNQRQQSLLRSMTVECFHVEAPLQRLEHNLEPFAVFLVMPVFAFANAGVHVEFSTLGGMLLEPVTIGIFLGLLVGKPVGVFAASYFAVRIGWAMLPRGVTWPQVFGVGFLAGIGFTMSMFINGLAFKNLDPALASEYVNQGKVGIMFASILAAIFGLTLLRVTTTRLQS